MTTTAPTWEVRSDLPGRLRLRCDGLMHSEPLRRHCRMVLTGCHWLEGFRINPIAGCLSLRFPVEQRQRLESLLQRALNLPRSFAALQATTAAPPRSRRRLWHAAFCVGLIGVDGLVGVPLLLLQGATTLLLLPMVRELLHRFRRERTISAEVLKLGFNAVLLQQGLPREALLDLSLEDGSEILQTLSHAELSRADCRDLLTRLAEQMQVRVLPAGVEKAIGQIMVGERIALKASDPVFVPCRLQQGSLVVINRQLSGDWHPRQLNAGDRLEPGCLVVAGEAELEVMEAFHDCPLFQLPAPRNDSTAGVPLPENLRRSEGLINGLLLGLGGFWSLTGASERALAAFQFNPIDDWETSREANRLAAVAELRLHGVTMTNADVLSALGRMQRLLVSRSCAERLELIQLSEEMAPDSRLQQGELLRILAGLQQALMRDDTVAIWTVQLESVDDPIPVSSFALHDLEGQGWQLELQDGRRVQVLKDARHTSADRSRGVAVEPLEFREGEHCLGWITLQRQANASWLSVRQQLEQIGVAVTVVGQVINDQSEADQRLQVVEQHQEQGEVVGYMGDVLHDIPALTRADVAIGLDFDEAGLLTHRLCDVSLSRDLEWLPRLVMMGRSLERTAGGNAMMIALTHLLSSLGTAGLALSPLQTVLLADIPLLLAELHNINSFQTHTGRRG